MDATGKPSNVGYPFSFFAVAPGGSSSWPGLTRPSTRLEGCDIVRRATSFPPRGFFTGRFDTARRGWPGLSRLVPAMTEVRHWAERGHHPRACQQRGANTCQKRKHVVDIFHSPDPSRATRREGEIEGSWKT